MTTSSIRSGKTSSEAGGAVVRPSLRGRGFTLIELIAVVVLVGLLLAISPAGLQALIPERELEAEVGRLRTVLDALLAQAILDQTSYAMHYDTENAKWAMQIPEEVSRENPDGSEEPVTVLMLDPEPDFEALDWHLLPDGITFDLYEGARKIEGRYMITFDPRGTVPPHAVVFESNRIASLDENDRTRTLKVNFSGLVSYAGGRVVEDFKKTESELGR